MRVRQMIVAKLAALQIHTVVVIQGFRAVQFLVTAQGDGALQKIRPLSETLLWVIHLKIFSSFGSKMRRDE